MKKNCLEWVVVGILVATFSLALASCDDDLSDETNAGAESLIDEQSSGDDQSSENDQIENEELVDYFYSTDESVHFVKETDFTNSNWDTGAVLLFDYDADSSYTPCISISSGSGWGIEVGVIAFSDLATGLFKDYSTLVFKLNYSNFTHLDDKLELKVKLSAGAEGLETEKLFSYESVATELSGAWYQLEIPLSSYSDEQLGSAFQFAIMVFGSGTYLITDIGLLQ